MRQIKMAAGDRPVRPTTKPKKRRPSKVSQRKAASGAFPAFIRKAVNAVRPLGKILSLLRFGSASGTKVRARTNGRRRRPARWIKFGMLGGSFAALVLLVGLAGYYIVTNSLIEKAGLWAQGTRLAMLESAGLIVQEVSVVGRDRVSAKALMSALAVTRGDSILDFDPDAARIRLENLGWIEEASVMRRYPDEIFVRIQERRPFARWQENKKTVVIDRKGIVVSQTDDVEFRYLPKVVGRGANEKAAELFDLLAKSPTLFTRLQNAVRIRDRRWNLEFGNGMKVMLPEEGSALAWAKLGKMQRDDAVLNKGVLAIDLRNPDRVYVKLKPGDAEFRRVAGSET